RFSRDWSSDVCSSDLAGSSPTRRGVKVHEIFMCEPTPDPPADVDFSKVQDSAKGTVRGRLLDHMENTGCTACHRRSDPPGLALRSEERRVGRESGASR